ncbi:MAG: 4Fe-4S dicluster domain-containing protein [Asgard group archaeon]|nr:4Fe-4S dicluster domain-containing protein [Asgard group archaeon]
MIKVDLSKCTGCRRCETHCAFYHTGKVNNYLARIKVINLYEIGVDSPVVCQQCSERYCMKCTNNALTIGSLGQIIVSPTNCNLCGLCESSCPIGAIEIFNDIVYVCDLCGGAPKCIEVCTEGALTLTTKSESVSFAEIKKKIKGLNSSQKRHHYTKIKGEELRKSWRKVDA